MSKENDPIDYESALERTGGDKDFLQELLQLYMEEFTSWMKEIQKAIEKENFKKIKEAAHGLKGASGNLSLPYLQEASHKMEKAGEDKDLPLARTLVTVLGEEFERLKDFVS